jgi:hypothetical protein
MPLTFRRALAWGVRRQRIARAASVFGLLGVLPAAPCLAAVKTDIVELVNGDRVTCEIRKLERGKLTVKTDGIGTIAIEWDDIARVTSTTTYDIELKSGERYFGSLARGDARTISVVSASGAQRLAMLDVIRITPLRGGFFHRLDGSISAGFSFTEANLQTQWTFDTNVEYKGRYWVSSLDADSALTSSEDADRQTRNTLLLQSARYLRPRWAAAGFMQLQQNEELALNLRSVLGTGIRRVVSQSNRSVVTAIGAVAFTREQYTDSDESVAEAVFGGTWDWFTFDGRSTNFDLSAITFYSLNGDSRVRLELNSSFKSDIVGDLYWSVNFVESFNSAPPADQKKNDFAISASVGWSF